MAGRKEADAVIKMRLQGADEVQKQINELLASMERLVSLAQGVSGMGGPRSGVGGAFRAGGSDSSPGGNTSAAFPASPGGPGGGWGGGFPLTYELRAPSADRGVWAMPAQHPVPNREQTVEHFERAVATGQVVPGGIPGMIAPGTGAAHAHHPHHPAHGHSAQPPPSAEPPPSAAPAPMLTSMTLSDLLSSPVAAQQAQRLGFMQRIGQHVSRNLRAMLPAQGPLTAGEALKGYLELQYAQAGFQGLREGLGAYASSAQTGFTPTPSVAAEGMGAIGGAGIGMLIGGPPGALIGAMGGTLIDTLAKPSIEAGIAKSHIEDILRAKTGDKSLFYAMNDMGDFARSRVAVSPELAEGFANLRLSGANVANDIIRATGGRPASGILGGQDDTTGIHRFMQKEYLGFLGDIFRSPNALLLNQGYNVSEAALPATLKFALTEDNALKMSQMLQEKMFDLNNKRKAGISDQDFAFYQQQKATADEMFQNMLKRMPIQMLAESTIQIGQAHEQAAALTVGGAGVAKAAQETLTGLKYAEKEAKEKLDELIQAHSGAGSTASAAIAAAQADLDNFVKGGDKEVLSSGVSIVRDEGFETKEWKAKRAEKERALKVAIAKQKDAGKLEDPAVEQARAALEDIKTKEIEQQRLAALAPLQERQAIAEASVSEAQLGLQTQLYAGVSADKMGWGGVKAAMDADIDSLKAMLNSGKLNPTEQASVKAQIAQLTFQRNIGLERQKSIQRIGERTAETALGITRFEAGLFQTETYGSATQSTAAVFQGQEEALNRQLALKREILTTDKDLTYQEKLSLQNEIEGLELSQKKLGAQKELALIAARTTEMRASHIESDTGAMLALLGGAGGLAEYTARKQQLRGANIDLDAARKELTDILKHYDYNSPEAIAARQKVQQAEMAQAQADLATAVVGPSAGQQTRAAQISLEIARKQLRSGEDIRPEVRGEITLLDEQIAAQQKVLQDARADKADPMREAKVAAATKELSNLQTQRYQLETQILPVTPPKEQIAMSNIQTRVAVGQMTFASEQNMRGALTQEQGLIKNQLSRLQQNRSERIREGSWQPVDEESYTQQKNELVIQAAQAQQQLEQGWLDRLISTAFNMPSNGRLITSQFTHREASMFYGIYHQAFGGTQAQMDYALQGYHRYLDRPGGAAGVLEGALSGRKGGDLSESSDPYFGIGGMFGDIPGKSSAQVWKSTDPRAAQKAAPAHEKEGKISVHLLVDVRDGDGKIVNKVNKHINNALAGDKMIAANVNVQSAQRS